MTNKDKVASKMFQFFLGVGTTIIGIIAIVLLTGCDNSLKPHVIQKWQQRIMCVDGVAYIVIGSSVVVKLHPDGKPYICVDTDTNIIVK